MPAVHKTCRFAALALFGLGICAKSASAGEKALIDTTHSPSAKMYMADLDDARWTGGMWGERFEVCRTAMIPNMWEMFQDIQRSHAWANFRIASGEKNVSDGHFHGPPFNDGDFLKWFEAVAQVYAITKDPELDKLMDEIIPIVAKAQREDGYLHTQTIIPERSGDPKAKEFENRDNFETYNMGHLMTAACVHYRATGKTTLLDCGKKAADWLYDFFKKSSPELARNAICPSHYMGVVEMYRVTKDPRYLELAKQLIEIRDKVGEIGTDQNQDRVPFRQMTKALGHAVRANYLYSGVADVVAENGDATLLDTLKLLDADVVQRKLYITGMTGALYDGASPDGSKNHLGIQLVHQAYGRDWQLPNLTAYNETCATIGFGMWSWRMLLLTGDAQYADQFERTLYNGVLAGISLDGKKFFYANPLRKDKKMDWPLRWSREREANIKSSFCCPPNVVRMIAEAQDYIYTFSKDTLWVNLYGASELDAAWADGGKIKLKQETDYPWDGAIKIVIEAAPEREIKMMLRIPGWATAAGNALTVNGKPTDVKLAPGAYAPLSGTWKKGDVIELLLPMPVQMLEANPLVEETRNQAAVQRGPIVYCLESNDLPQGVALADVTLLNDAAHRPATVVVKKIEGAKVATLGMTASASGEAEWKDGELYRPVGASAAKDVPIELVPYYAWDNRGDTEMSVWLPVK